MENGTNSITFLSKNDIEPTLEQYFIKEVSNIVCEYAIFNFDLSWCDLDLFSTMWQYFKKMCSVKDTQTLEKSYIISTHVLLQKFNIDFSKNKFLDNLKICKIIYRSDPMNIGDSTSHLHTKYTHTILFEKNSNISVGYQYKIEFEFYNRHIETLIQINNFETFELFVNDIYVFNKLNSHSIEHKNKDKKLTEMWLVWKKIFGPKIINDNLHTFTKY